MKRLFIVLSLALLPTLVTSQIVPVGSGSYTTQLPPPDAANRNVDPAGTPRVSGIAATKPIATSDWWTGLLTTSNANIYNYPLSLRAVPTGLVLSYTILGKGITDTRQPMGADQPIVLGVTGLSASIPTVSDYSDWSVTASWASGTRKLSSIIGMGMPFVYLTKGTSDVASVTIAMGTVSVQSEMLVVTNSIGGANFAIYAPVGSTWTKSGTTYTSTLAGKNYFSAAMLPVGIVASTAANEYKKYAYVFPNNPTVTWSYDNASSTVKSTFTVTPDIKEGTGTNVLLGLLPHQWAHLTAGSAQPGTTTYTTSRGSLKMLASNTFSVENKFKGILPILPNTTKYSSGFDPSALNTKIDLVKGEGMQLWTDSYNDGLQMNKLIQVAKLADQNGNTAARNQIINTVKARLENWFKAEANENAFVFYYNSKWTTLIGYPAGHYSDRNLNDHNFHYGYFISAAAAVEEFQPGWASQWGDMVNLLVKDAANWDKTDTKFPFLRNFSPYAGHSFANGLLINEPHGNNQESSSEAMNFNSSLINWGVLTNNTAIRDLGIYLYTTEQTAIDEYWFNVNKRNFSANYSYPMCSRVWGDGYDAGTFWTGDVAAMYGINMVPLTAASLYLGQNTAHVTTIWNSMKTKTGVLQKVTNPNLWYEVYWSYLAFADPATAINLYNDYPTYSIKNGESDANTYYWLHSFNGAGQLDPTITANYPIATVFNKAGNKTYVAHNYGSEPITVNYSDGYSLTVPARTMKTSKDINETILLTSSATQIISNETVTLTAAVTGTVSKVEFYNGATLIGSKTVAPYTLTTAALATGKHSFYAKVYNNTSLNLSNIINVTVSSPIVIVTGVTLAPTTLSLAIGTKSTLAATVAPTNATNKTVTWASSNPAIATVSTSGVVTPVAVGTATITATTTDQSKTATCVVTVATPSLQQIPGKIEAEKYTSMLGIQTETTTDTGGGINVGWIDATDYMNYNVNVASTGTYQFDFRIASTVATGVIQVKLGSTILGSITLPNTGGWQVWQTVSINIPLTAGAQTLQLYVPSGGFNLNWINTSIGNVAVTGVTLTPTTLALNAGATSALTATVAPTNASNKAVSYMSSNTAVATVNSSGFVTGVTSGTATITVTTTDQSKTATCVVTVTNPSIVVTGVTLAPTTLSLAVGTTSTLAATVAPTNATNKTVTWASSNPAIATVSTAGIVTALASGTATITVTTTDQSKTASCAITVTAATGGCSLIAPTGDFTVNVSNDTSNPTLTFAPLKTGVGSPTCILYYSTSATGTYPGYMATANTAYRINATAGATIYFYYTYSLPTGQTSSAKNSFTVGNCSTLKSTSTLKPAISSNYTNDLQSLIITPNPSKEGNFAINLTGVEKQGNVTVELIDAIGQVVYTNSVGVKIGDNNISLLTNSRLPSGLYIVKVSTSEGIHTRKVLIKK